MLPLPTRVDLGVMAMKEYSTFLKAPVLLFSVIYRTLIGGGLSLLQGCSQCILQPQLKGQYIELNVKTVLFQIIQFSMSMQFKCKNSPISIIIV